VTANKLDKVVNVAHSSEKSSASALRGSRQAHQQNEAQLQQLEGFKAEYEAKLVEIAGGEGMAARQLQDYRAFLGRLNQAIAQQTDDTELSTVQLDEARDYWLQQSQRSRALDHLVDLKQQDLQQRQDRAEQKATDELAIARHRGLA